MRKNEGIIGIDEVGRGALAGPVVVGAVFLSREGRRALKKLKFPFRDSKRLSEKQREKWFRHIKALAMQKKLAYSLSRMGPRAIDRINISNAANCAAGKAFVGLMTKEKKVANARTFLDGGLFITQKALGVAGYRLKPRTIIKGDENIDAIQLASIAAKVTRDKYMVRLHKHFPRYSFHVHKGYGTKLHRNSLKRFGASSSHRNGFVAHLI